jgi:Undecaprenyl-phosphate galactose phosphotransferase WbaP
MTTIVNTDSKTSHSWFEHKRYRLRMALIMLVADLLGFGAAAGMLLLLNLWLHLFIFEWSDLSYLAIVFICLVFYFQTKLYPGVGLNPAEEIRLVTLNTLTGFLLSIFVFSLRQTFWHPNHLALIPFSVLSISCVLGMRWGTRILSVHAGIWGAPVVVVGSGRDANQLAHYFLGRARLGFIPKYAITETEGGQEVTLRVLNFSRSELLTLPDDYFSSQQIYTALVDLSHAPDLMYAPMFSKLSKMFPRLIFLSNAGGMSNTSFRLHDFEGVMGMEMSRSVLSPFAAFNKRGMDIFLSLLLLALSSPLWLLTILLIRLDSRGPIFYSQLRVGKSRHNPRDQEHSIGNVHKINIYKFRTMVVDADQKLADHLNANPQAREEWNCTQKLRDDPRITRVGKWLRKFSIDELPQLINVLKGEMSIVGPRPMMLEQITQYGSSIDVYCSVRPGVTGLWQVSGRNNTSFEERTSFDEYYVHNWSIWLDVYILLRTIWVVLSRDGAY